MMLTANLPAQPATANGATNRLMRSHQLAIADVLVQAGEQLALQDLCIIIIIEARDATTQALCADRTALLMLNFPTLPPMNLSQILLDLPSTLLSQIQGKSATFFAPDLQGQALVLLLAFWKRQDQHEPRRRQSPLLEALFFTYA
jgi:hypothetical protein